MLKFKIVIVLLIFNYTNSYANISMPNIIGPNMVLQSNTRVKIWGKAEPGEKISVIFRGQKVTTIADSTTNWSLYLKPFTSDNFNTYTMTVAGNNKIELNNILCGDVWLVSGQSNMEMRVKDSNNSIEEISKANNNKIRLFHITKSTSIDLLINVEGRWEECSTETVSDFSAVGYFFGKDLFKKTGIPLGLIQSSYGGTVINAWMSKESLKSVNAYDLSGNSPNVSSEVYNAMIYPIHNVALKSILWYQGESAGNIPDTEREEAYRILFEKMISDWRIRFNNPNLPFLFIQLSGDQVMKGRIPNETAEWYSVVRGAQFWAYKNIPNTGMAVTYDIGDLNNVHYTNKQEVGRRTALVAREIVYGEKNVVFSGPIFDHAVIKRNKVILYFSNCGSGLVFKKGINGSAFTIAGKNKVIVKANAIIKGNSVVVSAPEVTNPFEVNYVWFDALDNLSYLYNKEGLPAASFGTGVLKLKK